MDDLLMDSIRSKFEGVVSSRCVESTPECNAHFQVVTTDSLNIDQIGEILDLENKGV